ncbi:MAG TPA: hypothetical protein VGH90_12590, partial [Chthoniobacteraceae bacterium]
PTGKFEPPSARARGVHIDVRLDEVVLRALEKEPALRYQQASEVKERVQTIASTNAAPPSDAAPMQFGKTLADLIGAAFTSRLALQAANLSALGFLCFLGFVPLPGWHRLFGFSGFFGLIGVAVIIEAVARWSRPAERARLLSAWLKVAVVLLLCFLVVCFMLFRARQQSIAQQYLAEDRAMAVANEEAKAKAVSPIAVTITHVSKGDLPIHLIATGNVEKGTPGDGEQGVPASAKFAIPESKVQMVFKRFRSDEKLPVVAQDQSGAIVARGALSAMDNQIDPATGTLNCKASLTPESDTILLPGQFLRLDMLMETKHDATIVPIRAVVRVMAGSDSNAAAEPFVWVLRPDHTVALRPITIAAMDSGRAAVSSGLQPGEPIVIDPPANLSEGANVNATP